MTVERKTKDHHGGPHVALIGPLVLPAAERDGAHSSQVPDPVLPALSQTNEGNY